MTILGSVVAFLVLASYTLGYFMGRASKDDEKRNKEDKE